VKRRQLLELASAVASSARTLTLKLHPPNFAGDELKNPERRRHRVRRQRPVPRVQWLGRRRLPRPLAGSSFTPSESDATYSRPGSVLRWPLTGQSFHEQEYWSSSATKNGCRQKKRLVDVEGCGTPSEGAVFQQNEIVSK
jgi:hypothetical protein